STYIDGLMALVDPATGKVHTTFNQAVTTTGRLSSTEPNLQNIPIRLELGRRLRKAFVPGRSGDLILAADYSQIELRVLAHISQDPYLLESFRRGQDVHRRTAAEIFGVSLEEVTPEMRERAKAVNFGIVYGISDYGLSRDLGVPRREAKEYIDNYFARYAGVKAYIDGIVAEAREKGYVTTLMKRRRYLPDINSRNYTLRSFAERTAMNTPIQGSAADIIKTAMVEVFRQLKERRLATRLLLQVHDELIFTVPREELAEVKALVKECMEGAVELDVPLVVELKVGENWYEVKKES
ncbi:MAG: DNA polymerase, partial [bacterium]